MGGIIFGALLMGGAWGWRADILARGSYTGGTFIFVYLIGGLGFALLLGGLLQEILNAIRPGSVRSIFNRKAG